MPGVQGSTRLHERGHRALLEMGETAMKLHPTLHWDLHVALDTGCDGETEVLLVEHDGVTAIVPLSPEVHRSLAVLEAARLEAIDRADVYTPHGSCDCHEPAMGLGLAD